MEEQLKEMLGKRPEELEGETLKLFEAIMKIADERDELKVTNKELEEAVDNFMKGKAYSTKQLEDINKKYIPISKIKEKLKELETKLKVFEKDIRYCKDRVEARLMNDEIYVLRRCMNLLKEIVEDK